MSLHRVEHDSFQAVIVTVCLEPTLGERLVHAIAKLPWLLDVSHLSSYSSATRRPAFGPMMRAANVAIVFIDYTENIDQAIGCTQYLVETFGSKLTVVAVGSEQQPDLVLEAMRAGCSEFIAVDTPDHVLDDMVRRLGQRWSGASRLSRQDGALIAVLGAKGGVGTTTLAVHLAYSLVAVHKKRVLLIDSQLELGHVSIHLGIDGEAFTFPEVVRNVSRLDSDLLQGFVAKHKSGLAVLSSPARAGQGRAFDAASISKALDFVRSEYDYVIVDCDRSFTELTKTVLDSASRIFLVATPEISAVRDLSCYADLILQNPETVDLLHVVLNRCTAQSGLDVASIEKTLGLPVQVRISNNYPALIKAGNLGEPLPADSKVDVAQEIKRWAGSLVQIPQTGKAAETAEPRERGWSLWGKRRELQRKGALA